MPKPLLRTGVTDGLTAAHMNVDREELAERDDRPLSQCHVEKLDRQSDDEDGPARHTDVRGLHGVRECECRADARNGGENDDVKASAIVSRGAAIHPTAKTDTPLRRPEHSQDDVEGVLRT